MAASEIRFESEKAARIRFDAGSELGNLVKLPEHGVPKSGGLSIAKLVPVVSQVEDIDGPVALRFHEGNLDAALGVGEEITV